MRLSDFIAEVGTDEAAKLFGVTSRAVQSWRYQARTPRPETVRRIVEATDGKVSWAECFRETSEA